MVTDKRSISAKELQNAGNLCIHGFNIRENITTLNISIRFRYIISHQIQGCRNCELFRKLNHLIGFLLQLNTIIIFIAYKYSNQNSNLQRSTDIYTHIDEELTSITNKIQNWRNFLPSNSHTEMISTIEIIIHQIIHTKTITVIKSNKFEKRKRSKSNEIEKRDKRFVKEEETQTSLALMLLFPLEAMNSNKPRTNQQLKIESLWVETEKLGINNEI